jgi:glutaredoxin-like YruB-family protein
MKVTIYTSETCPFCDKAKEFLKKNNIKFKEVNVKHDREAAEDMVRRSGYMLVPVIEIDGKFIIGFKQSEIKQALHLP